MTYRNTASFGKRQEFVVMVELLKRGFDVYLTLVDDQGIDCVVRIDEKRYLDIQIKARSKNIENPFLFAAMKFKARKNYIFIFYTEKDKSFWTIPSIELEELSYENKNGKNIGKKAITMPKGNKTSKAIKFEKYKNENGFKLLK